MCTNKELKILIHFQHSSSGMLHVITNWMAALEHHVQIYALTDFRGTVYEMYIVLNRLIFMLITPSSQ
jgi:hypothetical protein